MGKLEISIGKIEFTNLDNRLEHLSQEEIVKLMELYYAGEKVAPLIKDYGVKINVSQLYSIFPPLKTKLECEPCGATLLHSWASKTWLEKINRNRFFCNACGHENGPRCPCDFCKEAREIAQQEEENRKKIAEDEKREAVLDIIGDDTNWTITQEEDLSLEDRLYLATVLRASLSEDTTYIKALEDKKHRLAPTIDFQIEIIKTLTGREILVPATNSKLSAFSVTDKGISYEFLKVNYRLNIAPHDFDDGAMIKRLVYPDSQVFEDNREYCAEIWRKVAHQECLEYLLHSMNSVGYSFNPGEKTIRVFEHLLDHFSVAQIYGIIYSAIAHSTKRYQAGEITKIHAQNSVITSCEGRGERAVALGWKLSNYNRIRDLPETIISKVLFTTILKIAELGFTEKPTTNF